MTFRQALVKLAPAGARRIFDYLLGEHGDESLILRKAKFIKKYRFFTGLRAVQGHSFQPILRGGQLKELTKVSPACKLVTCRLLLLLLPVMLPPRLTRRLRPG